MLKIVIVLIVLAVAFFLYVKNKSENRRIERRERTLQKQQELIESLQKNKGVDRNNNRDEDHLTDFEN